MSAEMTVEITMPLMRPIHLPPRPEVSWWNLWGKAKNTFTLAKPRKWIIEEEYKLYIPELDETLCIPLGFVFDGASVPRVLWPFMSPTGAMFLAGLFHDFGYRYNCYYDEDRNIIHFDEGKKFFDEQFRSMGVYINKANKISRTAWIGLYFGGFMAWNEHRENNIHPYTKFPKSIIKE